MKQAVEMTAHGKPGKRYNCFPPFPQALEIKERFPHYHRHDEYLDEQIFHLRTPKNCPNYRSRRIRVEERSARFNDKYRSLRSRSRRESSVEHGQNATEVMEMVGSEDMHSIAERGSKRGSGRWNLIVLMRRVHLYLGMFSAPAILFFALTGILQTLSLHEFSRDGSYKPPMWIVVLAQIHKKQSL